MADSVFAMVCIEGKAPSDWYWKEITEKVFAKKEESTEVMHVKDEDSKIAHYTCMCLTLSCSSERLASLNLSKVPTR